MRLSAPLMTVVGTVAGIAAATVAYQSATGAAVATDRATTSSSKPVIHTDWLPCEKGWRLEGGTCVQVKERVVVTHDRPSAPAPQASFVRRDSHHGVRMSSDGPPSGPPSPSATPTPEPPEVQQHEAEPEDGVEQPETEGSPTGSVGGGD